MGHPLLQLVYKLLRDLVVFPIPAPAPAPAPAPRQRSYLGRPRRRRTARVRESEELQDSAIVWLSVVSVGKRLGVGDGVEKAELVVSSFRRSGRNPGRGRTRKQPRGVGTWGTAPVRVCRQRPMLRLYHGLKLQLLVLGFSPCVHAARSLGVGPSSHRSRSSRRSRRRTPSSRPCSRLLQYRRSASASVFITTE